MAIYEQDSVGDVIDLGERAGDARYHRVCSLGFESLSCGEGPTARLGEFAIQVARGL